VTTLAVIGANGFVGSAFVRQGTAAGFEVTSVTRKNYASVVGQSFDVVVDAAANSRKYLADAEAKEDFRLSVEHRLNTLMDFQAGTHLHVSSVDVYDDLTSPETTKEDRSIDVSRTSRYGFHKLLAEELVRHYASDWLIVRLAGMLGPGLKKNPVFDILHGLPMRIHPDSRYQFMLTDDAARIALLLLEQPVRREIYNVCGKGLISPQEIANLCGLPIEVMPERVPLAPRLVDVNLTKVSSLTRLPETSSALIQFLAGARHRNDSR
jgi:nucleoside-diphosphate-sugar epimerase